MENYRSGRISLRKHSVSHNFLIFFRHKLRREKKVVVEYKAMEFKEVDEDKLKKDDIAQITAYIVKHYENPDLTLKTIRKALGITENRISMLIRTKYQMGYKEYIHQIKINEAKRLFKESKLNINEVATIVGFGNISTFNRVFKDLEGMTASQYIEKIKSWLSMFCAFCTAAFWNWTLPPQDLSFICLAFR